MTIDDVKKTVDSIIQDGTLTLSAQNNSLNSPNINTLITTYFAGSLTGKVHLVNGETAQTVGNQLNYSISIPAQHFALYLGTEPVEATLTFSLSNEILSLSIGVTFDTYRFTDSFVELQNRPTLPINQLTLRNSVLTLDSTDTSTISFSGDLPIGQQKLFQSLAWLFPGNGPLHGTIQFKTYDTHQYPIVSLQSAPLATATFGNFSLALAVRIRTAVQLFSGSSYIFFGGVEIVTAFITPEITINVRMPLYGEGQYLVELYLDLLQTPPAINNFNDVAGFLGGYNPADVLGSAFSLDGISFTLDTFNVILNPITHNLVSLQTGISLGINWTVIENILELESISTLLTVNNPATPNKDSVSLSLLAKLKVGSVNLDAAISIPAWTLEASLEPGSTIDIADLMSTFGKGVSLPGNDKLQIYDLDFFAQVKKGQEAYMFEAAAGGSLSLFSGLALNDIGLSIVYQNGAISDARLNATMALTQSKVNLYLLANYQMEGGWLFLGSTGLGQKIPIGTLIADLASIFNTDNTLPPSIAELTIDNLDVTFNTQDKNFTFTGDAIFPLGNQDVDIAVTIAIIKDTQGQYSKHFGGTIAIGTRHFKLRFDQNSTSTYLIATYDNESGEKIKIKEDLIAPLSADIAQYIPDGLEIDFKDVLFVFSKSAPAQDGSTTTSFLFGLDLRVDFPALSNLPLVGKILPADQTIKVNNLQVLVASTSVKQGDVVSLNNLIPNGVTKLAETDLSTGPNFSASIDFGGTPQILAMPVVSQGTPASPAPVVSTPAAGITATDNVKWFTLQKAFGPVNFNRVGVKYQDATVSFLLDASLSLGGLTLSLDGLSFGSSLKAFQPQFDLRGLGLDYNNGPAEIGGAFLRGKGTLPDGKTTYDEYAGAAVIRTEELTLSALGSYAILDNPSLFIYAILDYPLGGPSFFFITGLAAGFGYNRSLIVPPVDQIASFPLVAAAVNGDSPPQDTQALTSELNKLAQYIHPELGENFFAIGIKFTSFKIIDSFVLLTVAFGNELEIDVLGLSTMIQPPPVPGEPPVTPIAVVQMALKASFVPARGFLGVSAQLTSASYLIDRACQLTGGFAFYTWFAGEHAGEFVQTLGGYHPNFVVPDYYPRVPRLGYNWQVDSQLSIKGAAYFALTAANLMAGLQVQANWNSGNLQAWFNITADFIIAWKPFHYDATAHANVGVSYTFEFLGTHTLTFDVGADLHIWGPEFSGQAHINLDIISFDVSFGSSPAQQLSPITWDVFKQSFLPHDSDVCSIGVTDGMVSKQSEDKSDLGVINPKNFVLVTNAVVPSSEALINTSALDVKQLVYTVSGTQENLIPFSASSTQDGLVQPQPSGAKTKSIGSPAIGPMGVQSSEFTSTHTIVITRKDDMGNDKNIEHDFAYTPVLKNVPTAMWGQYARQDQYLLPPDLNGQRYVADALSGFEIRPAVPVAPVETTPVNLAALQYAQETINDAYGWLDPLTFQAESLDEANRRQRISASIVDPSTVAARQQLCTALGVSTETIDLSQDTANELANTFLFAPQIEKV